MERHTPSHVAVLGTPGVPRLALGTALASLPIGALGLSVLLLLEDTGGLARAGLVVAALAVGTGIGIEAQGRLMDSYGQPRVLLGAAALQLPALVTLVLAAGARQGTGILLAAAALAGACEPQAGGALRALWTHLVDRSLQHTAASVSSLLLEVPVTTAPLLLAAALGLTSPAWAVIGCGVCSFSGSLVVATSAAARSWRPPGRRASSTAPPAGLTRWAGALASPGVRALGLVAATAGIVTAAVQVSAAGAATLDGEPWRATWSYSALSAGSLLGLLREGSRSAPPSPTRRLATGLALVALTCAAAAGCAAAGSPVVLDAALFAAGLALAPVTLTCFASVRDHAPGTSGVGAFTALTASALVAAAGGTAVAGALVQATSPVLGCAAAASVSAVAAVAVATVLRSTLDAPQPSPR